MNIRQATSSKMSSTASALAMRRVALVAACVLALMGSPTAHAVPITWNSTSTDMNANGSWSGNPVSTNNGVFAVAGTATNPTLTGNLALQSLTFAGTGVSGWTVSGPYALRRRNMTKSAGRCSTARLSADTHAAR